MKTILIFDRQDSTEYPGGDTVQIQAICDFLRGKGHNVIVQSSLDESILPVDLALIFNLTLPYDTYLKAKWLIDKNIPYIIFPIFWDFDKLSMDRGKLSKNIFNIFLPICVKRWIRLVKYLKGNLNKYSFLLIPEFSRYKRMINFILINASGICPNSEAEATHLFNIFGNISLMSKTKIIFNGIDYNKIVRAREMKLSVENQPTLPQDFICCVGGIGPRKNQLNLVKAANQTNIPLVIIGNASRGCGDYAKKAKSIAGKNVFFIDYIDQKILYSVLLKSRGHIQPSYIETPGLVSLEAAALNINIAVSNCSPTREYFGPNALYCNPTQIESIKETIIQLHSMAPPKNNHIFEKFAWDSVLEELNKFIVEKS